MCRVVMGLLLGCVVCLILPTEPVQACPMCKVANEDAPATASGGVLLDPNARPRAYMYSILFMLAVPASMVTGLGVVVFRMVRRESLQLQAENWEDSALETGEGVPDIS